MIICFLNNANLCQFILPGYDHEWPASSFGGKFKNSITSGRVWGGVLKVCVRTLQTSDKYCPKKRKTLGYGTEKKSEMIY